VAIVGSIPRLRDALRARSFVVAADRDQPDSAARIGWFIPRLHAFPADNTPVVTRAAALLSLCSYCRR
jgi:hypothetical protein